MSTSVPVVEEMHVRAIETHDPTYRRVRIDGALERTEISLRSTHPLSPDLTPWLPLVLPAAMHLGVPLHLHGVVDRALLEQQATAQTLLGSWYPSSVRPVGVTADETHEAGTRPQGVGLLFSGGVDAFHSALLHRERITHLLFVHGFDIPLWRTRLRAIVSTHLREVAAELGVELIEATVDSKPWMDDFVRWGEVYHGAATAGVALAHGGAIREALIASSEANQNLAPWGSHPDLDPLWSSSDVSIVHDAIEYDRISKVRDIVDWDLAMDHLRVCWENPDEVYNCGTCEKCVRTMVNLWIAGGLERCVTLPHELDLRRLRRPALNEEERHQITANLASVRALDAPHDDVRRALTSALRRGALLRPLHGGLVRPARRAKRALMSGRTR